MAQGRMGDGKEQDHQQAKLDEAVVLSEQVCDAVDVDRVGLVQVIHLVVVAAGREGRS